MSSSRIRTRLLIISDTHGATPQPRTPEDLDPRAQPSLNDQDLIRLPAGYHYPLPQADVLIHCGDLTKRSRVAEFEATCSMLREAPARLKLVIAGNHDGALDAQFWDRRVSEQADSRELQRASAEIWRIIKAAEEDNVRYLDEGTHTFALENGAILKVYASPWTPKYGFWGFQYDKDKGHNFNIPADIDVAMTHGPAKGILDLTSRHEHAGCPKLLGGLQVAKPRIHCFGHIHEAWGAYLAKWKEPDQPDDESRGAEIDEDRSQLIMDLDQFWPALAGDEDVTRSRVRLLEDVRRRGGLEVNLAELETRGGGRDQTLFLNAAVMDVWYKPMQCPWLVDIDLVKMSE